MASSVPIEQEASEQQEAFGSIVVVGCADDDVSVLTPATGFLTYTSASPRPSLTFHPESAKHVTRGRQKSLDEEFTVNKLNFSDLGLYGRDREIQILKDAFDKSKTSRQLVLVSGHSGTGKSALCLHLKTTVQAAEGFYIMGKFDQQQGDEPYAGIAAACRELSQELLSQNREESIQEIRQALKDELGQDGIAVVTTVIPNLQLIVGTEAFLAEKNSDAGLGNLEAKFRFNYAFRRFIRVICQFGKLVLTLDDLQWADPASLELMESLLTDTDNPGILVLGSYRSNEVDESHALSKTIRDLESAENSIAKVSIGNLHVPQINEMLVDLIHREDIEELAECVHKKTLGNVFFVIQYLKSLSEQGLLSFSIGAMKWSWDIEKIKLNTSATDNVVDLIVEKMRTLPTRFQQTIPLVASLGATFEYPLFQHVMKCCNETLVPSKKDEEDDGSQVTLIPEKFMNRCKQEGLVAHVGGHLYQWEHDKIQEAALSLIANDVLSSLQLQLGELLLDRLNEAEVEQNVFVIVKLLEGGDAAIAPTDPRRVRIAELNLSAGEKAMKSSAFSQAAEYSSKGITLLPADHWRTQYKLSLDLYSTAAEALFCVGDFDQMRKCCDEVIAQTDRPFIDKRRTYNALLHSIATGQTAEARQLCLEILAKLDCRFPKRGLALFTLAGFARTEFNLKSTTDKIRQLSVLTDESKIWVMALLDNLFTYTYQGGQDLLPLVVLKGLRWTIQYGISEYAPATFSCVGLLLAGGLGDFKGGCVYGELAVDSLKMMESARRVESRVLFVVCQFIFHWQKPWEQCKSPLLRGYESGMAFGDTESACWCIYCYLEMIFHTGGSLESISSDCRVYGAQMKEVKQHKIHDCLRMLWQLVLNLIGVSSNKHLLTGEALDQEALLLEIEANKDTHLKDHLNRIKMFSAFWFGEYEVVLDIARETDTDRGYQEKSNPGTFGICPIYFHCAISAIILARRTRKKRFKTTARFFANKIKGWVKKGNPNVVHYESLVDAEMASLSDQLPVAAKHYEVAILLAARRGFTSDQALAHELFAAFYMRQDNTQDAEYHASQAITLYDEWGASAKSRQLGSAYGNLVGPPAQIGVTAINQESMTTLTG